ncbi:MAG: hypothetical protein AB7E47_08715 [Desulfovibrionaceae bacterium]
MATSVIEICNNALLDLGEDTIASLADDTKQARLCNQRWPGVRDAVLRAHPWNCCMRQAELAASAEAPAWKWACQYPLPADFLRIIALSSAAGQDIRDWEVQGRAVLCDESAPIYLSYVRRETDPQQYDALLAESLAARMSAVLAYPLTGSTSLAEALWQAYQSKVTEARGVDAREGSTGVVRATSWLSAKRGG